MLRSASIAALVSLSCLACSKPGEESNAKRSPIPEPPPGAMLPKDVSIPVEHGDRVVLTIDRNMLASREPDFQSDDRRAWRLDSLINESLFPPGAVLEAEGSDGVGISMHRPKGDDSPLPVIVLTRRGELVAAIIKASNPFPDYHGQGGRLRRPGDPMPRLLTSLVRLRVRSGGAVAPKAPKTRAGLQLQRGETPASVISPEVWDALPSTLVSGDSGGQRTLWNLRDVVAALADKEATLLKVIGPTEELIITAQQWSDATLRPVLQENRRGELKFHWLQGNDKSPSLGSVHGVRLLQIAP